jgi:shikimate dehydrogenase
VILAGVLGFPVGHSRSPAMMNAAFAELGLDWRYLKLPVPPERFVETVRALPRSGYRGANVTIPHKLAARDLADERGAAARAIGAANTLAFQDGRIRADNTDAGGLLDALGEPVPATALVLGAGGAGRAAAWALREAGTEVAVWNRTPERAEAVATELRVRHASRPESAELVVNATPVGLTGAGGTEPQEGAEAAAETLGLAGLGAPAVLVDLVYGADTTALCRWAAARGARVVDGLEVLVRQGARSLELWTGRAAPLEVMRRAAAGEGVQPTVQVEPVGAQVEVVWEERYWYPDDGGQVWLVGYQLFDSATGRYLGRDAPELAQRGLRIVGVAGAARHHAEAVASEHVGPGRQLELRRVAANEHDPNAIAVHPVGGGAQVGWVPREVAAELAPDLDAGRPWTALVLREHRHSPRHPRHGLTMLLAPTRAIELVPVGDGRGRGSR